MNHIEGYFKGIRNANIYYQAWLPEGDVKAVMLIVHGLGEHSGRYMNFINHFLPLGYAAYAMDHIGHGKSDGGREIVEKFEDYTDTLEIYFRMVKDWMPNKPIVLVGQSLGGLIATYYLLDHQDDFKAAVLFAPAIKMPDSISPLTIAIAKLLAVLAPRTGTVGLDVNAICRDPEVVKAFANDPLIYHGKTPARLGAELLRAMQRIANEADKIILPFIALQGGGDRIINPEGAQMLYDKATSKDKAIKIYPDFYHELFNDPERAIVLSDVETWLKVYV